MILGPSLAATKLSNIAVNTEPEYADLHFVDVEIMDGKCRDWTAVRGLLDSGNQGNCINKVLLSDALTDHRTKQNPTTMIMADGHDSSAGPITQ